MAAGQRRYGEQPVHSFLWDEASEAELKRISNLSNSKAVEHLHQMFPAHGTLTINSIAGKRARLKAGTLGKSTEQKPPRPRGEKPKGIKLSAMTVEGIAAPTAYKPDDPFSKTTGHMLPSEESPTAKPLLDLAADECRWPVGEDLFCGAKFIPQRHGKPYCEKHRVR